MASHAAHADTCIQLRGPVALRLLFWHSVDRPSNPHGNEYGIHLHFGIGAVGKPDRDGLEVKISEPLRLVATVVSTPDQKSGKRKRECARLDHGRGACGIGVVVAGDEASFQAQKWHFQQVITER